MASNGSDGMTAEEGFRRAREVVVHLDRLVRGAIERRAVMEAGNIAVKGAEFSKAANAYNIIHSALTRSLSVDVAAMFDWSRNRPVSRQVKASIPSLLNHLGVKGVVERFIDFSDSWNAPDRDANRLACRSIISKIKTEYDDAISNHEFNIALRRLESVRNDHLAHNLFEKSNVEITYAQLIMLLDYAKKFSAYAIFMLKGHTVSYDGEEMRAKESAEYLWKKVLS
jgi:hypothetical protein